MEPFSIKVNVIDNGFLITVWKNGDKLKTFFSENVLTGLEAACGAVIGSNIRVYRESLLGDDFFEKQQQKN